MKMKSGIFGEQLNTGMTVWAENVKNFPGDCMLAEVIETDLEAGKTIGFWFGEYKSEDCLKLRQVATPAAPVLPGEDGKPEAWVTYWPAALCFQASR